MPKTFEVTVPEELIKQMREIYGKVQNTDRLAAEKVLNNIIFIILRNEPFFGSTIQYLNRVQSFQIPIAGVGFDVRDLSYSLYYNPYSFNHIDSTTLVEIVKHELFHLIMGHTTDPRLKSDNHDQYNCAVDMVINPYLKIPKSFEIQGFKEPFIPVFPQPDWPNFESSDYYYLRLMNFNKKKCGCGACKEGKVSDCPDSQSDNKMFESHKLWKKLNPVQKKLADELRKHLVEQGKLAGKIPEALSKLIESSLPSDKIPWDKILERSVGEEYSDGFEEVFSRRNRRAENLLTSLPGKLREKKLDIYVGIDNSGSIDDKIFGRFMGVIENIQRKTNAKIITLYCSCDIHHIEEFKKKKIYDRHGTGGTAFTPVLEYVRKQPKPSKVLIYLTDGYGDNPSGNKYRGFKTIWVTIGQKPAEFGQIIEIKE